MSTQSQKVPAACYIFKHFMKPDGYTYTPSAIAFVIHKDKLKQIVHDRSLFFESHGFICDFKL